MINGMEIKSIMGHLREGHFDEDIVYVGPAADMSGQCRWRNHSWAPRIPGKPIRVEHLVCL